MKTKAKDHFLVTYNDPKDGTVLELSAEKVSDSSLGLGFIAISGFLFDESKLVVTPDQETLRKRLSNVKVLHISIYAVLSIQEIGAENKGLRFCKDKSNVVLMPSPVSPTPTPSPSL